MPRPYPGVNLNVLRRALKTLNVPVMAPTNAQILASDAARLYEFGPFRLDPRTRRLYRDGEVIPLSGKVYDTLVILVRSAGRVVEKDDLMKLVWPDRFVTDDSLTQSISILRKALGETPDAPRFVVTIPRRGYRFTAGVLEIPVAPSLADSVDTPTGHEFTTVGKPADVQVLSPDAARTFAAPARAVAADARAGPVAAALQSKRIANGTTKTLATRGALQRIVSAGRATTTMVVLGLLLAGLWWVGIGRFAGRRVSAGRAIASIAVLPLENFSRDPDQEHLADGMTEALITRFGGLRSLRVISRTSAMQFKDTRKPVPEIAKALAVDAVVTGSVQRSGDRIRTTVQLIRSNPEEQLWSATYDRDMHDVLALQSELALIVAKQVGIVVTGADSTRVTSVAPTVSPEVYDRYLKGRFQFNKYTQASVVESITHFEAAMAADAGFAPAYVGLAAAYSSLGTITIGASPPSDVLPKAVAAANRALELDPTLADAYVWLAIAQQQDWRWVEAETALRRALELNPSHAHAHAQLGWWLLFHGRTDEAIASSRRGRDLDPLATHLHVSLGVTLYNARRYAEATRELESLLAIEPDNFQALMILGLTLVEMARFDEAIRALEHGSARSERSPMILGTLAGAYARAGQQARAQRIVDELVSLRKTRYVTAGAFVFAYMGLGEHDQAFVWLERAYAERNNIVKFIGVNPIYDPVQADPRLADLVRRVGLARQ